jgi:hypothetical protein
MSSAPRRLTPTVLIAFPAEREGEPAMDSSTTAVVVSAIALVVSLFSLWFSALSPFALRVVASEPRLTVYGITHEHKTVGPLAEHFIPSFDLSLTFHNTGRRAGTVSGLRLLVKVEERGGSRHETYKPIWIVTYGSFHRFHDRFKWLAKSVESEWFGIFLQAGGERTLHLIFESAASSQNWTRVSGPKRLSIELQAESSARPGWTSINRYVLTLPSDGFGAHSWGSVVDSPETATIVATMRSLSFDDIDSAEPDPEPVVDVKDVDGDDSGGQPTVQSGDIAAR